MAKRSYMYLDPDNSSDSTEEKHAFSMLEIKRPVNGQEMVFFYIIPGAQEERFMANPNLVDTSLDAKVIYQIEWQQYGLNKLECDKEIEEIFDGLVQVMGVVTDQE